MSKPTNHQELTKELWKERVGPWPVFALALLFFFGLGLFGVFAERESELTLGVISGSTAKLTIAGNDPVLLVRLGESETVQVSVGNEIPIVIGRGVELRKVTTVLGREYYSFVRYRDI